MLLAVEFLLAAGGRGLTFLCFLPASFSRPITDARFLRCRAVIGWAHVFFLFSCQDDRSALWAQVNAVMGAVACAPVFPD